METITPRAGKAVVTEVWKDSERLVRKATRRFCRKYRQRYRDALDKAALYFLEAYHTFDPEQGNLPRRIAYVVYNRLFDDMRKRMRKSRRPEVALPNDEPAPIPLAPFDVSGVGTAAGPDGKFVMGLVLDAPGPLADVFGGQVGVYLMRRRLQEYLLDVAGWNLERIRAAFAAVREALP